MEFKIFANRISKIKDLPLPGELSHFKMAPPIRIELMKAQQQQGKTPRKAAVMALFYPNDLGDTNLLLILRKSYNGVHSNQIGFPGGKFEKEDADLEFTALRETYEEVGVPTDKIEVVRAMSKIYIPPSNFEVHPFIGLFDASVPFKKQEREVERLIEVSLSDFMSDENLITEKITTSYAKNIDVPAFKLNGYIVWGATGMMLSEIKALLVAIL